MEIAIAIEKAKETELAGMHALTQSDAFLKDIDSAEEQISRGTMIPLDQAIEQLGLGILSSP